METILVDGEAVRIGDFKVSRSNFQTVAYLPSMPISIWLPAMYEVHAREEFARGIASFRDTGRNVSFVFVDASVSTEHMKETILQLATQAAQLQVERERERSRSAHPSNPDNVGQPDLEVVKSDHPRQQYTNVPLRRRR